MFQAIVQKEVRQQAIILILGGVATVVATCIYAASFQGGIPFVSPDPSFIYGWAVLPLAIALGLAQAIELERRSSVFLLHLPVQRRTLVFSKLSIGLVALLVLSAIPMLILAIICFAQAVPAPFFWSMTSHVWRLIFSSTVVYLGAFLCGIRPAKWFGTRLLPLVGLLVFVPLVQVLPFYWWVLGILLLLGINWLLIETIVFIAGSRDYT